MWSEIELPNVKLKVFFMVVMLNIYSITTKRDSNNINITLRQKQLTLSLTFGASVNNSQQFKG